MQRKQVLILGISLLFAFIIISSCSNTRTKPLDEASRQALLQQGDSISQLMQQVLLNHVAAAMQEGGSAYAVAFCNLRAIPLTDSIAAATGTQIKRLSDKNRNPDNHLATTADSTAWHVMQTAAYNGEPLPQHLLEQDDKEGYYLYYKPITLGMPTCLKCHGDPQTDISPETMTLLQSHYPVDLATGYQIGALRGMWKISFNNPGHK